MNMSVVLDTKTSLLGTFILTAHWVMGEPSRGTRYTITNARGELLDRGTDLLAMRERLAVRAEGTLGYVG